MRMRNYTIEVRLRSTKKLYCSILLGVVATSTAEERFAQFCDMFGDRYRLTLFCTRKETTVINYN